MLTTLDSCVIIKLTNQTGGIKMTIAGKKLNRKGKITLSIILAVITIFTFLSFKLVNGEEVQEEVQVVNEPTESILSDGLKEISIVIREGDTAWDIQSELTPNRDVLEIINQLEELNNMSLDNIKPGSVIKFAIEG